MIDKIASQPMILTPKSDSINKESGTELKFVPVETDNQKEQQIYSNPSQKEKSKEKLEGIIKGLNDSLNPAHTSWKFTLHEKLNEYYMTIVDDRTNEVVKEIPSKKMLDTFAAMRDYLGLIMDKKI